MASFAVAGLGNQSAVASFAVGLGNQSAVVVAAAVAADTGLDQPVGRSHPGSPSHCTWRAYKLTSLLMGL